MPKALETPTRDWDKDPGREEGPALASSATLGKTLNVSPILKMWQP